MFYYKIKTPVTFIIFNRPETTKRMFAEITKAGPSKLLVITDGPRVNHPDDVKKCAAVRAIINGVDWNCEVFANYSDVNLGCKRRVSNISFGHGATHTQKDGKMRANLQTSGIEFPLISPPFMVRDAIADGKYTKINMDWKLGLIEILKYFMPTKGIHHKLLRRK